MTNYSEIEQVAFPLPSGVSVNMMPIITGDAKSMPDYLHKYLPLINATGLPKGEVSYITVNESQVAPGQYQRRPGVHTDGTAIYCWGGGWGGGGPAPAPPKDPWEGIDPPKKKKPNKGIYIASSDGRCQIWDEYRLDSNEHGGLTGPQQDTGAIMKPEMLYWMTDRTPHESLTSEKTQTRQFFRLVADDIGIWWAKHSTANPFGLQPNSRITHDNKF